MNNAMKILTENEQKGFGKFLSICQNSALFTQPGRTGDIDQWITFCKMDGTQMYCKIGLSMYIVAAAACTFLLIWLCYYAKQEQTSKISVVKPATIENTEIQSLKRATYPIHIKTQAYEKGTNEHDLSYEPVKKKNLGTFNAPNNHESKSTSDKDDSSDGDDIYSASSKTV